MKSFLINTCLGEKVGSKPQASAKRSILELYDSSEDELNKEAPKKKHLPVVLQYPNYTIIAYVNRFFTRSDINVKRPAIMYSFIHVKRLAIKDAVGDRDKTSRGIVCKIRSADKDWVMEISDLFQVRPVDDNQEWFALVEQVDNEERTASKMVFRSRTSRCLDPDESRRLSEFLFSFEDTPHLTEAWGDIA
ncbi:Hypothetical predicted protein [Paramuricea clavata]|uniref:Uncharacterized protein n=1 Tax=Paramuricea clavata TaxID=317549 RepID=A0A6S7I899_PARCT|nr:Hypothetical predicted protein [Paramuricea clavata]